MAVIRGLTVAILLILTTGYFIGSWLEEGDKVLSAVYNIQAWVLLILSRLILSSRMVDTHR